MFGHSEHFLSTGHDFAFREEEAVVAGIAEFNAEGVANFTECVCPIYSGTTIDYACLKKVSGCLRNKTE